MLFTKYSYQTATPLPVVRNRLPLPTKRGAFQKTLVQVKNLLHSDAFFGPRFLTFLKYVRNFYTPDQEPALLYYAQTTLLLDKTDFKNLVSCAQQSGRLPWIFPDPILSFLSDAGYSRWQRYIFLPKSEKKSFVESMAADRHNRQICGLVRLPDECLYLLSSFFTPEDRARMTATCEAFRTELTSKTNLIVRAHVRASLQAHLGKHRGIDNQLTDLQILEPVNTHDLEFLARSFPKLTRLQLDIYYQPEEPETSLHCLKQWEFLGILHSHERLIAHAAHSLGALKQLKELCLPTRNPDEQPYGEAGITALLRSLPQLERLQMGNLRADENILQALASSCPQLKELHLWDYRGDPSILATYLSQQRQLEVFEIEYLKATEDILTACTSCSRLKELHLWRYEGDPAILVNFLKQQTQLEIFEIRRLQASEDVLRALSACHQLKRLCFKEEIRNSAQEPPARLILDMLAAMPQLEELHIESLSVDEQGLQALGQHPVLQQIDSLTLTPDCTMESIVQYVQKAHLKSFQFLHQQFLYKISYVNHGLTIEDKRPGGLEDPPPACIATILIPLLEGLPHPLQELTVIVHNRAAERGTGDRILATLAEKQPLLEKLTIQAQTPDYFTPEGLHSINTLTNLRSLTLGSCRLTDEIVQSFQTLKLLRQINLQGSPGFKASTLEQVQRMLPELDLGESWLG